MSHGVAVGVGVDDPSNAAATRFDLGWVRSTLATLPPVYLTLCGYVDRSGIWGSDFQVGSDRYGLHKSQEAPQWQ